MLRVNQITYEIWDELAGEILVDNLSFDDAAEQSKVYQDFFGPHAIVVLRESTRVIKLDTRAQEYKRTHLDFVEELFAIGNL